MKLIYADTSALVRAYFADEPEHHELRVLLRESPDPVVTSELARLEFTSATFSAARTGRLRRPDAVVARFDEECREDGPVALLALEPMRVFPECHRLIATHPVRTLDAIHLAVALLDLVRMAGGSEAIFITRDEKQGIAAQSEGLTVL